MTTDNASVSLDQATFNKIIDFLQQAEDLIPKLQPLTAKQGKEIDKTGIANIPFVHKAYEEADNNADFLPPHLDLSAMKQQIDYDNALMQIEIRLAKIACRIADSRLVVGCEAMKDALSIFTCIKQAVRLKIEGAAAAQDKLNALFVFRRPQNLN